jgi:hypothetical protein
MNDMKMGRHYMKYLRVNVGYVFGSHWLTRYGSTTWILYKCSRLECLIWVGLQRGILSFAGNGRITIASKVFISGERAIKNEEVMLSSNFHEE